MTSHNDLLVIIPLSDGETWHLMRDAIFFSKLLDAEIVMKHGYEFNFASVPRPFWIFYPPATGLYRRAAAFHDWMYDTQFYTKEQADLVFNEIMKEDSVSVFTTSVLYHTVKYFGWSAWEDITEEEIRKSRSLLENEATAELCMLNF